MVLFCACSGFTVVLVSGCCLLGGILGCWNVKWHSTKSIRKGMSHMSHGCEGHVVNRMTKHGQYVACCKTCWFSGSVNI